MEKTEMDKLKEAALSIKAAFVRYRVPPTYQENILDLGLRLSSKKKWLEAVKQIALTFSGFNDEEKHYLVKTIKDSL